MDESRNHSYRFLPPQLVESLQRITVDSDRLMDSGRQGRHRSPLFGSSVEFAEYRRYFPGDPVQHIDWSVYAKTRNRMIRKFSDEVSMRTYVCLDISESMDFQDEGPMSKLEFARFLAAGLLYLMVTQGDMTTLWTFDDQVRHMRDLAASLSGIRPMLLDLEAVESKEKSRIGDSLHEVAERVSGRAMVVVISDFLEDPDTLLDGVRHLAHDGKDVTLFQILDPGELRLPPDGLYEIEALEGGGKLEVDMDRVRTEYEKAVRRYLDEVRSGCIRCGARYITADTRQDVRSVLLKRGTFG